VLSICVRCGTRRRGDDEDGTGQDLYDEVKAQRKARGLKELFKVEDIKCLGLCDEPCAIQLEGKKRSTIARVRVRPSRDAALLVEAARAYAALSPGQELPERLLPGEHAD
jgi:predicted metal-binding protein